MLLELLNAHPWQAAPDDLPRVGSVKHLKGVRVSSRAAGPAFDLGCKVREALFDFFPRHHPHCLPRVRSVEWRAEGAEPTPA